MAITIGYEKRYQSDGSYKIWEVKHNRYIDENQATFLRYVEKYGIESIKIVDYVEPEQPEPYVPTLEELREQKRHEITQSYNDAAQHGACRTGVFVEGIELIVDYSVVDRELWSKGIIAGAMAAHQAGIIELDESDIAWCNSGVISPSMLEKAKNVTTIVRAHDNSFMNINLEQMHKAAIAQNYQVQKDLEHKWALEALIDKIENIKVLETINWDTDPSAFMK